VVENTDENKANPFLPARLTLKVQEWRNAGYPSPNPVISEILDFNISESETGEKSLRYLRRAQFEALETYWYLRLVEETPKVFELYRTLYADPVALFEALGIELSIEDNIRLLSAGGPNAVLDKIRTDDDFVKSYKLETVRESLNLDYPSYILALAMGAGKTVLIGSIIATEFAMALQYKEGFVKNALVFAPGKTILGALKELSDVPFERILPPAYYKQFLSSVKVTYTQDNEKGIPIVEGSSFNIIVTNTEKIRIQKPTGKPLQQTLLGLKELEKFEEETEIANLRLQMIASLPNLAIFSDEAHHTYGQSLDTELKKVRKTVDYLAQNTNVLVVVNTTGTPYYRKAMLKDVVYWYGLSQGIKDGILKEVRDSIYSYDEVDHQEFSRLVLEDFFKEYRDAVLFDGSRSKLAIYFPQTNDLERAKPAIERRVGRLGLDPSIVLAVHNESEQSVKDLFNNRVNEPSNPYRVYLLVNMGTEGWNCPSLFATALARKLKTSNNFVLQAASRCLRQVPGNSRKARIYLSKDNVSVLDSQLSETYGETLQSLKQARQDLGREKIILRKEEIPPILVRKRIRRVVEASQPSSNIQFTVPVIKSVLAKKTIYDVKEIAGQKKTLYESGVESIVITEGYSDLYNVAVELGSIYRIETGKIYGLLLSLYPDGDVPTAHIDALRTQLEGQVQRYAIKEEEVEVALALIKKEGFEKELLEGRIVYTAEIVYHKDRADLLLRYEKLKAVSKNLSFHYSPYHMDSHPEKDFFLSLLNALQENPDDIEEVYFTGAITDPKKTDFLFEYKDKVGKWRTYTPDFVIRKKDGRTLIVEVKAEYFRDETKEMAVRELTNLNPNDLKYVVLVTKSDEIGFENMRKVEQWISGGGL
jgi:type III restriction enzyme